MIFDILRQVEEFYKGKYAELDQILGGFEARWAKR